MKCFMLVMEMLAQLLDLLGLDDLRRKRSHLRLDQQARLEHFARFLARGFGNEGTAIGFQTHQPVMRQRLQGGANKGTADGIDRRQLVLRQLGAGKQTMADDRLAQAVIDRKPTHIPAVLVCHVRRSQFIIIQ